MGTQIAWLLPAALVAFVAVIALRGRAPRTDRTRAAVLLWGGWLVVTGLTLSYASGIIHSYYTVQLAPAIAALVAIGAVVLWRARSVPSVRVALAGGTVLTGLISFQLLGRSADWNSWLRYVVLVAALGGAAVLALPPARVARLAVAGTVASLVAVAGGSTAYALNTAASPHTGSTPSAGPASAGSGFGGRGGPGGGQLPSGGFGGGGGTPPGQNGSGSAPSGMPSVGGAAGGGAMGGASNSALSALLKKATTKWAAATMGDQSAAELELASGGKAVMAIGGWDGSDPAPTLAQFKAYVAAGQIRYFIAGSNGGRGGNSDITSWVESNYTSTTVGGTTVYDLTKAKG